MPTAFINLFPTTLAVAQAFTALALLAGPAFVAGATVACLRRRARRREVADLGRRRGLSEEAATFLGLLFQHEGPEPAENLLSAPELFRRRLGQELREASSAAGARELARRALALFAELGLEQPPFAGAPAPFEALRLHDPTDPRTPDVLAFVVSIDERSVTLVTRADCPWPTRRTLTASREGAGRGSRPEAATGKAGEGAAVDDDAIAPTFSVSLLLRPAPPIREWVLSHDLVDVITNRRSAVRVPCRLASFLLPESGDTLLLREALARDGRLDLDELQLSRGWTERHAATVLDLSPDGARLVASHPAGVRDRFHLLLCRDDGAVAALPLLEVVAIGHDEAGRATFGTRFLHVRIRERLALAEFVRALARSGPRAAATRSAG